MSFAEWAAVVAAIASMVTVFIQLYEWKKDRQERQELEKYKDEGC